jgi:lipoyl-dependent peroxiredoxin subunit D
LASNSASWDLFLNSFFELIAKGAPMKNLEALRETFPEVARDIKINLSNVLTPGTLNQAQCFGIAIACAWTTGSTKLAQALEADAAAAGVEPGTVEDAKAAAVLMGMNNVYYRFKHVIESEAYDQRPAKLRMMRLNQVSSTKIDFELFCLAVSTINNCVACVKAHEKVVLDGGLSHDHVHDSVRIAANIQAAAVALSMVSG